MATLYVPERFFSTPFCRNGHDKAITGITDKNDCRLCRNIRQIAYQQRKRRGEPPRWQDGRGIRDLRVRLGLSVPAFARRVGVSNPSVYDWEAGRKRISKSKAIQLADAARRLIAEHNERVGREQAARADRERYDLGPRGMKSRKLRELEVEHG